MIVPTTIIAVLTFVISSTLAVDYHNCAFVQCANTTGCDQCEVGPVSTQAKCVVRPHCTRCRENVTPVQCLVDPCADFRTRCPLADSCRPSYCGGCTAHYYTADLDTISECNGANVAAATVAAPLADNTLNRREQVACAPCPVKPRLFRRQDLTVNRCFPECTSSSECQQVGDVAYCVPRAATFVCRQPIDVGFQACAQAPRQSWAFVAERGACEEFAFYGCRAGNSNRFTTKEQCEAYCSGVEACPPYVQPNAPRKGCQTKLIANEIGCAVAVDHCGS